jgi:hypothetical protein
MDFGLSAEERFGSDTQGVCGLSSRKSWWVAHPLRFLQRVGRLRPQRKIQRFAFLRVFGAAASGNGDTVHLAAAQAGTLEIRILGRRHVTAAGAHKVFFLGRLLKHWPEFTAHHAIRTAYDLF